MDFCAMRQALHNSELKQVVNGLNRKYKGMQQNDEFKLSLSGCCLIDLKYLTPASIRNNTQIEKGTCQFNFKDIVKSLRTHHDGLIYNPSRPVSSNVTNRIGLITVS